MKPMNSTKRACAVAAAAAHDFNNELTVILSSVTAAITSLDRSPCDDRSVRPLLLDIQAAAQRCVWKASGLLNFCARVNPNPVRASFEYLSGSDLDE
jgi:hypothetical protein